MSSPVFSVKVVFTPNDIRRFALAKNPTLFGHLQALVASHLKGKPFNLKFVDDEGELCSITSEEELVEAFDVSQSSSLKVFVHLKDVPSVSVSVSVPESAQAEPTSLVPQLQPQVLNTPLELKQSQDEPSSSQIRTAVIDVPAQAAPALAQPVEEKLSLPQSSTKSDHLAPGVSSSEPTFRDTFLNFLKKGFSSQAPASPNTRDMSPVFLAMQADPKLLSALKNALPLVAMGPLRDADVKQLDELFVLFTTFMLHSSSPHIADADHKLVLEAVSEDLVAFKKQSFARTIEAFKQDVAAIVERKLVAEQQAKAAREAEAVQETQRRAAEDAKFVNETHAAMVATTEKELTIPAHFTGDTRDKLQSLLLMGFKNFDLNAYLLQENRGNLQAVVDWLLSH